MLKKLKWNKFKILWPTKVLTKLIKSNKEIIITKTSPDWDPNWDRFRYFINDFWIKSYVYFKSFHYISVQTRDDVEWTCDVSRCQNGGTCKKGRAQCVCRLGYVGRFCECKFINLLTLWLIMCLLKV